MHLKKRNYWSINDFLYKKRKISSHI
jgi:hypothetical protein